LTLSGGLLSGGGQVSVQLMACGHGSVNETTKLKTKAKTKTEGHKSKTRPHDQDLTTLIFIKKFFNKSCTQLDIVSNV